MLKYMGHTSGVLGRGLKGKGKEVLLVVVQQMENLHPRRPVPQPDSLSRKFLQGNSIQNLKIPIYLALLQGILS